MALRLMAGDTESLFGMAQDARAQDYFDTAMKYLKGSTKAKAIIDVVEKDGTDVLVLVAKECFPMYVHYEQTLTFGLQGAVIVWDPVGLISARASTQCTYQSPAIALLHEIGHGKQWIEKKSWYLGLVNTAMGGGSGATTAKLEVENDNIATHETPVAQELAEGVRKDYNDALGSSELAEAKKYYKTPYALLPLAHK